MFFVMLLSVLFVIACLCWVALGKLGGKSWRNYLMLFNLISLALFFSSQNFRQEIPDFLKAAGLIFFSIVWMAEFFFGFLGLFIFYFCKACEKIRREPFDPNKRKFFVKIFSASIGCAALYGGLLEPKRTVVNEFKISVKNLSEKLRGFKIAQISDVHLGLFFSLEDFEKLLREAAATKADLLAVTGDIFDDAEMNVQAIEILNRYCEKFPHGIYFCYGNHEYFRNITQTKYFLEKTDIHILENASENVCENLYLLGVDYPTVRSHFEELEKSFVEQAFAHVPENSVKILLAHHPDFIDDGAKYQTNLVLTGHTHGGQIGFLGKSLAPPIFKYMRGLYRVGQTVGYVHSGNGSWFPFRLNCPLEIACFILEGKIL